VQLDELKEDSYNALKRKAMIHSNDMCTPEQTYMNIHVRCFQSCTTGKHALYIYTLYNRQTHALKHTVTHTVTHTQSHTHTLTHTHTHTCSSGGGAAAAAALFATACCCARAEYLCSTFAWRAHISLCRWMCSGWMSTPWPSDCMVCVCVCVCVCARV